MRVLMTTHPGHGHFRPLLPLARALVAGGHEVRVGTSPSFVSTVEREGLTAEAAGVDWLHIAGATNPEGIEPPVDVESLAEYFAHKFVRATAEPFAADLVQLAREWRPDLIVRETTEYGGLLAAEVLGVPWAGLQVASPTLMSGDLVAEVAVALDEARLRLALTLDPTGSRMRNELVVCFAPPELHDPDIHLPAGLRSFHPGTPPADEPPPKEVGGLGAERSLIYATLGTVFHEPHFKLPFFPAIRDGLRDADVDLLMVVGPNVDPAMFGDQRPGVLAVRFAPQRAVLDRASVVICHGGYGTLLDAIDAAVPLVIVPFGADQPVNAAAVDRLGIGIVVNQRDVSPATIRQAVDQLLDPHCSQRQQIEQLQQSWRALPGPSAALRALTNITD